MKYKTRQNYDGYTKMGYLTFHYNKCIQALDIGNITLAKTIYNDILSKNPEDDYIKYLGFRFAFIDRDYELCKEIISTIKKRHRFFMSEACLYILMNDNDNMLRMYYEYFSKDISTLEVTTDMFIKSFYRMKAYFERIFNIPSTIEKVNYYSVGQELSYDRDSAIEHIKDHHLNDSRIYKVRFRKDIDIEKLLSKIEEVIERFPEKRGVRNLQEYYIIEYPNIGYDDPNSKELLNCIIVGVCYGSNNVITMYPSRTVDDGNIMIPYSEMLEEKIEAKEIKILSQIDKFNRKYGIK